MKDLMQTIIDVYSAPGSVSAWGSAVESISLLCGGHTGGYFLINDEDHSTQISANYGMYDYVTKAYESHGATTDIRYKYIHNLTPGKVFREFEFGPSEEEWASSEWNQYQYKEQGVYYWMGAKVSTHGLWSDYIAVSRLKSKGQNTDTEKNDLQLLLPHLSRAGELHRLVVQLIEKYNAVMSVLDKFLVGLVILDKRERVITANFAAREIGSDSGAYHFASGGYLRLSNLNDNIKLKAILSQTTITASQGGYHDGGHLVIKNRASQSDILLELMPIRDDAFPDGDDIQGTAIFILDPKRSQTFSTKGLKRIFKLTNSEGEVVDSLVNGLSLNDIADERNTSPETVRRQLKMAYAKTGTSGQLDLLRKAVKANPPIERKPVKNNIQQKPRR